MTLNSDPVLLGAALIGLAVWLAFGAAALLLIRHLR